MKTDLLSSVKLTKPKKQTVRLLREVVKQCKQTFKPRAVKVNLFERSPEKTDVVRIKKETPEPKPDKCYLGAWIKAILD